MSRDPRTYAVIGAAMEVHKQLGPGFLEAVYHQALRIEFIERQIPFAHEVSLPIFYKDQQLSAVYRADFICFDEIVVEVKAMNGLTRLEESQLLHYLKATRLKTGLLLNFGAHSLQYKRRSNDGKKPESS